MGASEEKGLGRRMAPDARDANYPLRTMLVPSVRRFRYWNDGGWWGDQGGLPHCVGFAWTHYLEDGPVTQGGIAPTVAPDLVYREAQVIDEWPGESYDGTSVRAGAKVLQSRGYLTAYRWAFSLMEVVQALLELGPLVVGTNWYESMFEPDTLGLMPVHGGIVGGHAYILNGVNMDARLIRVKNSWGRDWGNRGRALLRFDDFERLLFEDGEACIATELRK